MKDKKTGRSKQIGFVRCHHLYPSSGVSFISTKVRRFSMMHEATAALKRMNGSRLSPESPPLIGKCLMVNAGDEFLTLCSTVKYAESESQKSARRAQNFVPSPRVATPYFSFPQQVLVEVSEEKASL